jgi:hypothetical protein
MEILLESLSGHGRDTGSDAALTEHHRFSGMRRHFDDIRLVAADAALHFTRLGGSASGNVGLGLITLRHELKSPLQECNRMITLYYTSKFAGFATDFSVLLQRFC